MFPQIKTMLKLWLLKFDRIAIEIVVLIFLAVFVVLYFSPNVFYDIPSGHVGVMWLRFGGGTVTTPGVYLREGMHEIWPWNKIYVYDARLQKRNEVFHVLAADGLRLEVDVVYRYRINKKDVGLLQKYAGQDWADIMLAPSIAAKTRDIVSQDTPSEIYSTRRLEIQRQIREDVSRDLYNHFNPNEVSGRQQWIVLEDVLIRSVTPPPQIEQAIMRKYESRQNEEEYDFRLMAAAKEAERKKIEAEGIKEFQDIVSPGLSNSYLRFRGIEATQALASSKNAKVLIFGNSGGGLPLILGNLGDDPSDAQKAAPAVRTPAAKTAASSKRADAHRKGARAAGAKGPSALSHSSSDSAAMAALRNVLRKVGIPVAAPGTGGPAQGGATDNRNSAVVKASAGRDGGSGAAEPR